MIFIIKLKELIYNTIEETILFDFVKKFEMKLSMHIIEKRTRII